MTTTVFRVSSLAIAVLVATGCGAQSAQETAGSQPSSPSLTSSVPTLAPSPTSSPTALKISEEAACIELIPHLQKAADLISVFNAHPDGSKSKASSFSDAADDLRHDLSVAPEQMTQSIQAEVDVLDQLTSVLTTGTNTTIDYRDYKSAGLDLATRCAQFAS